MSTQDRPFFCYVPQSCQPPLGLVVEEEIRFNWARLIDDRRNVAYFYDLSFQQAGESRFLVATTLNQSFLASNQPSSRVSCDKMNEWRDWAVSLWSLWRNVNNQIKCWKFVISWICLRLAELKMSRRLLLIDDRHRFLQSLIMFCSSVTIIDLCPDFGLFAAAVSQILSHSQQDRWPSQSSPGNWRV